MSDFDRVGELPPPTPTAVFLQVGLGIGLVLLLHLVVGACLWLAMLVSSGMSGPFAEFAAPLWVMFLATLGLSQLLYVVPVGAALFFVRRPIALGMAIGAALTFVLQGACYGAFALMMASG